MMLAPPETDTPPIHALILAGGSGTRFWPLSRRRRPKQLLPLASERSLLADTVARLAPVVPGDRVWVCGTEILQQAICAELPELCDRQLLLEPEGRNTAPAIAWSVWTMSRRGLAEDAVIAVLPSDHWIGRPRDFRDALAAAARAAARERCVYTLAVRPRWPETGYGYLELEQAPAAGQSAAVRQFHEKPDAVTAHRYVETGHHFWNAGMFVFPAAVLLEEVAALQPDIHAALVAMADAATPGEAARLYREMPAISIDYALMERLERIGAVVLDCDWNDLGSFNALADALEADAAGNAVRGDVMALEAHSNIVVAGAGQVTLLGVDNLIVVQTADATLVMPRDRAQDVRRVVDELQRRSRDELL